MGFSSQDTRVGFATGFFYALRVIDASGQRPDLKKLMSTLEEIASREITIALTPTEHLLTMVKFGKELTAQQREDFLSLVLPQAEQDRTNKEYAELALKLLQGGIGTLLD